MLLKGVSIMKRQLLEKAPGTALAALIAYPAWLLGQKLPLVGSPVLGIVFGMLLAFAVRPKAVESGIAFTSKNLLQYSIVLLGFNMNLYQVLRVGSQTLVLIVFTLTATFLAAYYVGKWLKVDRNASILIGVGTAICGGSAIAATSPVIRASDEDMARSISTIFLFNVAAAFLFPALGHGLGMTDYEFGLWAGTAINDTSAVVAAGYTYSNTAGDLAVIVKLTRTLMIIPVTLFLAFSTSRRQTGAAGTRYSFSAIFPWFIIGFVAASMLNTFVTLDAGMKSILTTCGKYMIVMAMAAVGLNTNLIKLVKSGWRPLMLGGICWVVLLATSLSVQYAMHIPPSSP